MAEGPAKKKVADHPELAAQWHLQPEHGLPGLRVVEPQDRRPQVLRRGPPRPVRRPHQRVLADLAGFRLW
jgi:hypothetical protein